METDDPFTSAYLKIGQLLHRFSRVEGTLLACLRLYIGIDDKLLRAVVGEPKIHETIKIFRRVASAKSMDDRSLKLLYGIFKRIAELRPHRDLVAHRPIHLQGTPQTIVCFERYFTADSPDKTMEIHYTFEELDACGREAAAIALQLDLLMSYLKNSHPADEPSFLPDFLTAFDSFPWQQKPELPNAPGR